MPHMCMNIGLCDSYNTRTKQIFCVYLCQYSVKQSLPQMSGLSLYNQCLSLVNTAQQLKGFKARATTTLYVRGIYTM